MPAAPAYLRQRILRQLDEIDRHADALPEPRRQAMPGFARGLLSGIAATVVIAAGTWLAAGYFTGAAPERLIDDHVAAMAATSPIAIPSSDRHTVRPWLAHHADSSPPVPDLQAAGFTLLGGRAPTLEGVRFAVVTYQAGQHVIDLYTRPEALPWRARAAVQRGYHVLCWSLHDLRACAVSDVSWDALERFAQLQREAYAADQPPR